jgi:hypothetical protein
MTSSGRKVSLSPGCVTGVGSLPHTDPEEAVEFVAEYCPELPFWPQLPQRCAGEGFVGQGLGRLIEYLEPSERPYWWNVRESARANFEAGLENAEAGLLPETAGGFHALERAIRANRFPMAKALKAQIEGPVTLAHCLLLDGEPVSRSSEWLARLAGFLERQVAWQVRRLRALGLPVMFVLDEPTLTPTLVRRAGPGLEAIVASVRRVLDAARREGAIAGIHSCAPLPLGLLAQLDLDLLSFDAHLEIDEGAFVQFGRAMAEREGYLAYGLAPTGSTTLTLEVMEHRWRALAAHLGSLPAVAERSLVTATCGLGLSTAAEAAMSFTLARRMGALFNSSFCERREQKPTPRR